MHYSQNNKGVKVSYSQHCEDSSSVFRFPFNGRGSQRGKDRRFDRNERLAESGKWAFKMQRFEIERKGPEGQEDPREVGVYLAVYNLSKNYF